MSKYNLQDILNEYVGGSRHGTINISYRDLQDAMDKVEADGDFVVREKHGRSGDGKTNREFEVVFIGAARGDNKPEEAGFTVYDYKFGFDPADEDNFDKEYPFSVGGSNKEAALKIAKYLLGNRVQGYMANDKEILRGFDPKDINDVLFSFESNTDKDGEFKTSMGFNEEEMSKSEKNKLKKVSSQLKKSVKAHDKQSKTIDSIISEADTSKLTDDEKKELKFHLAQFKKGNIDYEDIMNVLDQFGLNENGHVDDYADEIEEGHAMSDNEADLEAGVKGNMDAFTEENMSSDDKEGEAIKIIKNMDPKTKKEFLKKLSKMGMGQLDEAVAEEESVGQYIIDYYRNPNKPEEMYVTDDIVIEYFKTHPDWDLIWGKSYEDGLEDFKEFFSANYDYMFDDARLDEEDKDKKELPDSIKKAEQDQIEKDARKSRGDIKEDMDEDSLNEVRKHFKRFMFDKYQ